MQAPLREQFITVTMRFKRTDLFPPAVVGLQQSELAVLAGALSGRACEDKGACVSDIHQNLHISKPAVSQTLNSLERKGYIIRTIDKADRRKIAVTLTQEGQSVLAEAMRCYEVWLDTVLEQLGVRDVERLIEVVGRLTDILEKTND